jgi:hypothetical protein
MPLIEMDNHKTNERLDKIMAAIDDLKAAIATLQTTVTSVVTALGTPGTNNDAQIEVDVAAITAANAALQAALAPGTVVSTPVTTTLPSGPVSTFAPAVVTHPVGSVPIAHAAEGVTYAPNAAPKPGDPGYRQTS